jgi:hypothetical protein
MPAMPVPGLTGQVTIARGAAGGENCRVQTHERFSRFSLGSGAVLGYKEANNAPSHPRERFSSEFPMKQILCLSLFLSLTSLMQAATINVPADQPTIQAAINVARNGDIVMVAPGTYFENVNFSGKAITVRSASGPKVTIIDGGNIGTVVTFNSGETFSSALRGFTIQHGQAGSAVDGGGGVYVNNASPEIIGNVITHNTACGNGAGMDLEFSRAVVLNNVIENNAEEGCTGGAGGDCL